MRIHARTQIMHALKSDNLTSPSQQSLAFQLCPACSSPWAATSGASDMLGSVPKAPSKKVSPVSNACQLYSGTSK